MIIKILTFLLLFVIVPTVMGRLISYKDKSNWLLSYLIGFFGNMAVFYILYSFVVWIQDWTTFQVAVSGGFTWLLSLYRIAIVIMLILWIIVDWKNLKNIFTISLPQFKVNINKAFTYIYGLVFAVLLLAQLYMAYGYEINEWSYDDYDYVVTSQDNITSDALSYVNFVDGSKPQVAEKRAVASWGAYVSMLSKWSGFEVTTIYHTILPVFLLLMAYMVYYLYALFFIKELEDRFIFLIILSVAFIFGLYSHYSMTFRLLGAIWQGKAVLVAIAVPLLIIYLIKLYKDDIATRYMLPIAAISLGMSSLTSLAIFFVPVVAILVWVLMCIYHKKLYGIRYLIASLVGPIYVGIFYAMVWMLIRDMWNSSGPQYFKFRVFTNRWQKWIH